MKPLIVDVPGRAFPESVIELVTQRKGDLLVMEPNGDLQAPRNLKSQPVWHHRLDATTYLHGFTGGAELRLSVGGTVLNRTNHGKRVHIPGCLNGVLVLWDDRQNYRLCY